MSKFSKLLKLLSASAIVAGSNSFALANCKLCESEENHDIGACPYFDYKAYYTFGWHTKDELGRDDKGNVILKYLTPKGKENMGEMALWDYSLDKASGAAIKYVTEAREKAAAAKRSAALKRTVSSKSGSTVVSKSDVKTSVLNAGVSQSNFTPSSAENEKAELESTLGNLNESQLSAKDGHSENISLIDINRIEPESIPNNNDAPTADLTRSEKNEKQYTNVSTPTENSDEPSAAPSKWLYEQYAKEMNNASDPNPPVDVQKVVKIQNARRAQLARRKYEDMRWEGHKRAVLEGSSTAPKGTSENSLKEDTDSGQTPQKRYVSTPRNKTSAPSNWLESNEEPGLKELFGEGNGQQASAPVSSASENQTSQANQKLYTNMPPESAVTAETTVSQKEQKLYTNTPVEELTTPENSKPEAPTQKINQAAVKLQNAFRAHNRRKEAKWQKYLKENLEDPEMEARTLAEAVRENESYRRQDQIESDYQFAKDLQAKYNAEDEQIRTDRAIAEDLQAEYDEENRRYEEAERLAEEERDAEAERLAEEERDAEARRLEEQAQQLQEQYRREQQDRRAAEDRRRSLIVDNANEMKPWGFPHGVRDIFSRWDRSYRLDGDRADMWNRKLSKLKLNVRQLEAVLWTAATVYRQKLNENEHYNALFEDRELEEAVTAVDALFNDGAEQRTKAVGDVWRAFELGHADVSGTWGLETFANDLGMLSTEQINNVLEIVVDWYADQLMNGSKAASPHLVRFAKAVYKHFGREWLVDDVEIDDAPEEFNDENNNPAPAVQGQNPAGVIEETEAPEGDLWTISNGYKDDIVSWLGELENLPVRRLEVLMFLAASSYRDRFRGQGLSSELEQLSKAVCNLFPVMPDHPNARLQNWYRAYTGWAHNSHHGGYSEHNGGYGWNYIPPRGFEAYVMDQEECSKGNLEGILGILACVYREKLRKGSRPADMAFVNLADEFCRASSLDGFSEGEDNGHPARDFREFGIVGDPVKPQKSVGDAKIGQNPAGVIEETEAPEGNSWFMPNGCKEALSAWRGDDSFSTWLGGLEYLPVRRLEVLLYVAAASYYDRFKASEGKETECLSSKLEQSSKAVRDLVPVMPGHPNARLQNWFRAYEGRQNGTGWGTFENDVENIYPRMLEKLLGGLATVYRKKLRKGSRPADMAFVNLADEFCRELNLDGFLKGKDNEPLPNFEEFGDRANPAAAPVEEQAEVPFKVQTQKWRLPTFYGLLTSDEDDGEEDLMRVLRNFTVRKLEAITTLISAGYIERCAREDTGTNERLYKGAFNLVEFVELSGGSELLSQVKDLIENTMNRDAFIGKLNELPMEKVESFLVMAFRVYDEKMNEGELPADAAFANMAKKVRMNFYGENTGDEDWFPLVNEEELNNRLQSTPE